MCETADRGVVVDYFPEPGLAPAPRLAAVAPALRPAFRSGPPHRQPLAAGQRHWQGLPALLLLPGQLGRKTEFLASILLLGRSRSCPSASASCWPSTIRRPSATARRWRGPASITTPLRGRPTRSSCTATFGSRSPGWCATPCG